MKIYIFTIIYIYTYICTSASEQRIYLGVRGTFDINGDERETNERIKRKRKR